MLFQRKTAPRSGPPDAEADLRLDCAASLKRLEAGYYDFVDLGTLDGGGFTIAEKQGGRRGLGFDISPPAVRQAKEKGLDVALYDVCDLHMTGPHVDFAVCSHILEHLPDLASIEKVLASLASLSRRYLLVSGPCFESEPYLATLGLKILHSLMLDHTCRMTVSQLVQILHRLELRDYIIALTEPVEDSENIWVHAAEQPVGHAGLWTYDADQHLPKPKVPFDRKIYRDFVCVVKLDVSVDCDHVLDTFYFGYDKVVHRSMWRY